MDYREKECIKEFLKVNQNKKIKVVEICRLINMTRSKFYQRYHSVANYLYCMLEADLYKGFQFVRGRDLKHALTAALKMIYAEQTLYLWIYYQTTHEQHLEMQEKLVEIIKEVLRDHANEKCGISNHDLHIVANRIYDQFLSVILHGCNAEFCDVLESLHRYVPEIEGHRFCYLKKKD